MFDAVRPDGDERVLDFAQSPLHGLLAGEQRLLGTRLLDLDAAPVVAGIEQRRQDSHPAVPEIRAAVGRADGLLLFVAKRRSPVGPDGKIMHPRRHDFNRRCPRYVILI